MHVLYSVITYSNGRFYPVVLRAGSCPFMYMHYIILLLFECVALIILYYRPQRGRGLFFRRPGDWVKS